MDFIRNTLKCTRVFDIEFSFHFCYASQNEELTLMLHAFLHPFILVLCLLRQMNNNIKLIQLFSDRYIRTGLDIEGVRLYIGRNGVT